MCEYSIPLLTTLAERGKVGVVMPRTHGQEDSKRSDWLLLHDDTIDNPQRLSRRVTKGPSRRRGSVALREIRKFQKTTHLLVPRLAFARVVRDFLRTPAFRIQPEALLALQEATEAYLVHLFEDA